MISDLAKREDELGGKTLLIVGLGRIGSHLASLAKAFGMRVIGTKRDPGTGGDEADDVFSQGRLGEILPLADFVALTCPLTPQTEGLINAQALAPDEAVRLPDQRGARQGRRRAGADRRARRGPHRGRRPRLHGRGAAARTRRRCGTFRTC